VGVGRGVRVRTCACARDYAQRCMVKGEGIQHTERVHDHHQDTVRLCVCMHEGGRKKGRGVPCLMITSPAFNTRCDMAMTTWSSSSGDSDEKRKPVAVRASEMTALYHTHTHRHRHGHRQRHRHGHRHRDRDRDTETYRHTDAPTHRHTDAPTHRRTQTYAQRHGHRHRDTQTHRHTTQRRSEAKDGMMDDDNRPWQWTGTETA
jgi:hypothetical protein